MPRHIDPPKSIAEQGGLKAYLNSTAEQHNGLAYRDFLNRINPKRKHKVPRAVIAEDFGVSTRTIYSWIHLYESEAISEVGSDQSDSVQVEAVE